MIRCKSTFFAMNILFKNKINYKRLIRNMNMKLIYQLVFLLLVSFQMNAQVVSLVLKGMYKDTFLSLTSIPLQYNSPTECTESLQKAHLELYKQGYLAASIDSIEYLEKKVIASVYVGEKYVWAHLKNNNIPSNLLSQSRFDEKKFFGKPVEVKKLYPVFEKIITYYEDNGFPFCHLYLDSLSSSNGNVSGVLTLNKGPLTRLDTIIINEDVNISRNYVMHYLGFKNRMLYNESKIKAINKRINELPFLTESYPWRIDFNVAKTTLNLYLKNKSANRADVLIGLLPNNDELGGKFLLTGDIKLSFVNALGQGEQIQLNWQNLQYKSPRYNIQFQLPYLLNTPIGISGKFDFYKKDTTFKTTNGELGLLYQLNASDQIKAYYQLASNRVGSINIPSLLATRALPANGDVTYRTFGIELLLNRVDYKINPRKGYRLLVNGSVSFRNLIKNTTIETTFDPIANKPFAYLYDSIATKSYKYNLFGQFSYFVPLRKRLILASIYSGGFTYSTNPLFRNELYQIGGYRLLRGFDEGSLFVNQYHVLTIEPRYLLSANSYFFLFGDISHIQSNYNQIKLNDNPYSLGAGMTFETRAGLFNISYAVGARNQTSLQLRSSKIHFGYINYF
jgi:hemolysin activation/secretion protein